MKEESVPEITQWPGGFEEGQEILTRSGKIGSIMSLKPGLVEDGQVPYVLHEDPKNWHCSFPDELTRIEDAIDNKLIL